MLQRIDVGAERALDAGGALRVAGDMTLEIMRLVADRCDFIFRVGDPVGIIALGDDAAGGRDLDEIDTGADVTPDRLPHRGFAVGGIFRHARKHQRPQHVEMAAGHVDIAAGEDARTIDQPALDRDAQRDRSVGAHVADRREARFHGEARIVRGIERHQGFGRAHDIAGTIGHRRAFQMHMGVDQTRHHEVERRP